MTSDSKDTLYRHRHDAVSEFIFDQNVVRVFPDMIKRSVPGYGTILHMIGYLAGKYVQPNSNCYDLGCSLGAVTLAMVEKINQANVTIYAVDNSNQMISQCEKNFHTGRFSTPIYFYCEDIVGTNIANASFCVANFTLQFIDPIKRDELIQKIYNGMCRDGIFILSEKIKFEDDQHENLVADLHHYFKKSNGYSEMEIAKKREALENVLIPETISSHRNRLLSAGFKSVDLWFQCFNFISLIAIK